MCLNVDLAHENTVKNTLLQRQAYASGNGVYGMVLQRLQEHLLDAMSQKVLQDDQEVPLKSKTFALDLATEMVAKAPNHAQRNVNGLHVFVVDLIRCYENKLPMICRFDQQFQSSSMGNALTDNDQNRFPARDQPTGHRIQKP